MDGEGHAERKHEITEGHIQPGCHHRLPHAVAVHGGGLQGGQTFQRPAFLLVEILLQGGEGALFQDTLDPITVADLADPDCLPDALDVAEIIATTADTQEKFRATHAKRVHFSVQVAVHLDSPVEITIRANPGEFALLPQKYMPGGMVTRR
jgi:hypothetical protein